MTRRTLGTIYFTAAFSLVGCMAAWAVEVGEFKSIFNGKDLTGWDGRPEFWSVKDGCIHGETTAENRAASNTFLIWREGTTKNFELRLSYRMLTGNNSGVQYRSREFDKWAVTGYQAEVVNQLGKTGFLYHEGGRGWLTDVGDFMEISPDGKLDVVGIVANRKAITAVPYHKDKEWNEYHIVCRGNHIVHYLNGYQTVELIDNHVDAQDAKSPKQRSLEGILALQIHGGAPMTVEYKDIRLKVLTEKYGEARRLFNGVDLSGWESDQSKWEVAALGEGADAPRRTKPSGPLHVIKSTGEAGGSLKLMPQPQGSFVLRYQRRTAGNEKTGGETAIKPVLGWETCEAEVNDRGDGKLTVFSVNGANVEAAKQTVACAALPSGNAVEYRNIVLIPIAK